MIEIIIPEYITHVQLSKSRRPKYYRKGGKIPKKYAKYKKFDLKGRLCDGAGDPIIANPATVNKPRLQKINGQQLYSGNMNPMMRSKVVNEIKKFMSSFTKDVEPVQVPIRVESDLYAPMAARNWDLDNQWIYHKCFLDALVSSGVLPDDNIMFITQAPAFRYFPVDMPEERKIIYRLIPEDRPEILEHPSYVAFHKGASTDVPEDQTLEF